MYWKVEYIFLILVSTTVNYVAAIQIAKQDQRSRKKLWLLFSLLVNLGLLFTFKYYAFFTDNINLLSNMLHTKADLPYYDFLLPKGISFYTFQTLSYTIDVYKGKTSPEQHFGKFAVFFVSYWPQLVAGPIERSNHLLPQLNQTHRLTFENVKVGLTQIEIKWKPI